MYTVVTQHAYRFFAIYTSSNIVTMGKCGKAMEGAQPGSTAWLRPFVWSTSSNCLKAPPQPNQQMHVEASTCVNWSWHFLLLQRLGKTLLTIDQPLFMTWLFMTLHEFSYKILIKWPRRLPQWRGLSRKTNWSLEAWTGGPLMRPSRPLAPTRKKRKKWTASCGDFAKVNLMRCITLNYVEFKLTRIDVIYVTCFDWFASKMKNVALSWSEDIRGSPCTANSHSEPAPAEGVWLVERRYHHRVKDSATEWRSRCGLHYLQC